MTARHRARTRRREPVQVELRRWRSTATVIGPPQLTVEHVVRICGRRWSVDKVGVLRVPIEFADDLEAALGIVGPIDTAESIETADDGLAQLGLWHESTP
jgi:hypothetical protein